ncbi:hypothetical protein FRC14_000632 [Serendipita sp. 396]|nr:hypothetical protein FRC14_000632 [Serendipita sp. 396]KAG8785702.1 hypothetical protein FRC15_000842 [Serendipita sp. 397]KAG8826165.1 hypothetical protein FRC19_009597 [Serendipita sp. 401]KAG8832938.1 hypothetical protein FRC18_004379 [Serendipita sp. 400]KAG8853416.1 hypothetical protein FRB91_004965 [Serendipita sp. 411]KAG8869928.1 hypothetical protein FRC20_000610 [Serendipita sp. 405]KAG9057174.1 hypothetical protein FS842_008369 [Serendipita sp. 407]
MHRSRNKYTSRLRPRNQAKNIEKKVNVQDFPDEVFSIIFEFYTEDIYWGNPWTLMHVCRQWRLAATHARKIWSRIMLTRASDHKSRRYRGYEVCDTERQLRGALARTVEGPIELCLRFDTEDTVSNSLIEVLRDAKAYLRIRALSIDGLFATRLQHFDFNGFTLPSLKRVTLSPPSSDLHERIRTTAPRLQFLELFWYEDNHLNWDVSNRENLTDFHIKGYGTLNDGGLKMVCSPPRLVNLSLGAFKIGIDKTISIPSLQSLRLMSTSIQGNMDLPRLKVLIMEESMIFSTEENPLTLPSLITFNVTDSMWGYIVAPSLHTLSIAQIHKSRNSGAVEPLVEQLTKPGCLSPRILHLDDSLIESNLLVRFLNGLHLLEEIDIGNNVPLTKVFFEALAGCSLPLKAQSEPGKPICPSLKSFKLSLHGIRNDPTQSITMKWPRLAVQARAKGQYPLAEALVCQRTGAQWMTML